MTFLFQLKEGLSHKTYLLWIGLIGLYSVLGYFGLYQEWGLDFSSYYMASHELITGKMPYHDHMVSDRVWHHYFLVANPNPPITLFLFSFFSSLSYLYAFLSWFLLSLILSVIGVLKTIQCIFPAGIDKARTQRIVMLYFIAFPVVMNAIMPQFGGVLLFLLSMGYAAYLKKSDKWMGFWFGLLIALKLFPGLLFFYVWRNRRYQALSWMIGVFLFFSCLPLLWIQPVVFKEYVAHGVSAVSLYAINWNAALLGFLIRIVPLTLARFAEIAYLVIGCAIFCIWMIYIPRIEKVAHRGFAFTILLMLFLSPLGWLYYFCILLLPMLCTLYESMQDSKRLMIWFGCLCLLYFPMPCIHLLNMPSLASKITAFSCHFYGLCLLGYLVLTMGETKVESLYRPLSYEIKRGVIYVNVLSWVIVMIRVCRLLVYWLVKV